MNDTELFTGEGLKKILKARYFSICTFREVCELNGIPIPKRTELKLEIMHCVDWGDMEPQTQQRVVDLITETLQLPSLVSRVKHNRLETRQERTGVLRLIGGR